jgi:hypothetical protein
MSFHCFELGLADAGAELADGAVAAPSLAGVCAGGVSPPQANATALAITRDTTAELSFEVKCMRDSSPRTRREINARYRNSVLLNRHQ